jgi:hypothetical protein
MQVNPNSGLVEANEISHGAKPVRRPAETDSVALNNSDELSQLLRQQEDVRANKVNNASALINKTQWPPLETIHRIANLLAIKLDQRSS